MAGHSKWAKVKHFEGAIDAKRAKIFAMLAKEVTLAVLPVAKLMDLLEDNDDVKEIYANAEIPEDASQA